MLIGELSTKSGFSRDTIRYYEKLGLLSLQRKARRANNYKEYTSTTLGRLRAIRALKDVGFTLNEIQKTIQSFETEGIDCNEGKQQLIAKIARIDQQINQLLALKTQLSDVVAHCPDTCQITSILQTTLLHTASC